MEKQSTTSMIQKIKNRAIDLGASDIFLLSKAYPACKVHGEIFFFEDEEKLTSKDIESYLLDIMSDDEKKRFYEDLELDFSLKAPGNYRYRVNVTHHMNGLSISFRVIPQEIPDFKELNLPVQLKKIIDYKSGLVLVTGSMGSGKSTTMASIMNLINKKHKKRIITIEDPIEFIHKDAQSIIEQREVDVDTHSFAKSLQSALRQGADVLLVGELRDYESISLALTAAETGVLVISSAHTNGAANTLNRLIDVFPANQQNQIQSQLSQTLKAVVWQTLLSRKDKKGRIGAFEILFQNYAVSNLIREGKSYQLNSILETGQKDGMFSMKKMLEYLIAEGKIDQATADKALLENSHSDD